MISIFVAGNYWIKTTVFLHYFPTDNFQYHLKKNCHKKNFNHNIIMIILMILLIFLKDLSITNNILNIF